MERRVRRRGERGREESEEERRVRKRGESHLLGEGWWMG
jgi:hypothetical protein